MSQDISQLLDISPEELKQISKVISTVLIEEISTKGETNLLVQTISKTNIMTDTEISSITEVIRLDIISSSTLGILDPIGQLGDFIKGLIDSAKNLILSGVETFFQTIVTPTINAIDSFLKTTVKPLLDDIWDAITSAISGIGTALTGLPDFIQKNILAPLTGFFTKTLPSYLGSVTEFFTDTLPNLFGDIINFFTKTLPNLYRDVIDFFTKTFPKMISPVTKFFTETLPSLFSTAINFFKDTLPNLFQTVVNFFTKTAPKLFQVVVDFFTKTFPNLVSTVIVFFKETLPKTISGILETTAKIPDLLNQYVISPLIQIPTLIDRIVASQTGLSIAGWFVNINAGLSELGKALFQVGATLQGFINSILILPEKLEYYFGLKYIADPLSSIKFFFKLIQEGAIWLAENTIKAFQELPSAIFDAFLSLGKSFVGLISNSVVDIIKYCQNLVEETKENVFQPIREVIFSFIGDTIKAIIGNLQQMIQRIYEGETQGEITETTLLFTMLVTPQLTFRLISQFLFWLGESISDWKSIWTISLKIIGTGGEKTIEIPLKMGNILKHLASEFREYPDTLMRGFMYGLAIWLSQPFVRVLNSLHRNTLPLQLPSIPQIMEISRRALSLEKEQLSKIFNIAKRFMALYGYSDFIIDRFFLEPDKYSIKVMDRFGKERTIPLSLIYELPSASDVARMAIRDIFGMGASAIENFIKIYQVRGMYPDIGILYYLLHYKYPSPEKLWVFTTRGISGLLWARIPEPILPNIKQEAEKLGAFMPKNASELNFQIEQLFSALTQYMTWHDYARFAFIKDFTSDNQIITDTLADIPSKIDQRWMLRWGLYQTLAERGVGRLAPIQDFLKIVVEGEPPNDIKAGVYMELANFCRTLQATGLHPYWVPITAVAEAMNSIADERTLLRTGFMNLFKEGFWSIESLETLLKGFITAYFGVQYFDMSRMKWVRGYIEQPVMFLPAERKLLELRALMDRSLDILLEIQKDVTKGYQEWIIESYEEYKTKLSNVIKQINEFFETDYKSITGKELPDKLKLTFVETYYKPYIKALGIWRDIYTIRRVRMWTQRWLGWIMYRVAYGAVKEEDMKKLIQYVSESAKLTPYETQFIKNILELLYGIVQREYAPTPSQLATLSEYMVISEDMIKKVFDTREIPSEWRDIWRKYIDIRPIADDVRGLISSYRRALLYTTIPKDIEDKVKNYASMIGFTDREWEVLTLRVNLEELIQEARESRREYIPTPYMLATLCEYLPEARAFFPKVAEAKRIPDEWKPLWAKYVDIRPLVDEIKKYVSRVETLYSKFAITEDALKKVLEEVREYLGYTDKEIEFIKKTITYERYRTAWSEVIGDVDRMMSLAEYSPKARDFALGTINKMIDALPVDDNIKNLLKAMWEQYIRVRPVYDEVKRYITDLINAYVEGIIDDLTYSQELEALKKWGLSDDEIMFYKAIAGMRKARKLKISLIYPE